jgi:hypothetical protein
MIIQHKLKKFSVLSTYFFRESKKQDILFALDEYRYQVKNFTSIKYLKKGHHNPSFKRSSAFGFWITV